MDAGVLASQLDEFRQLLIGINEDVSRSVGPALPLPVVWALH